MKRKVWVIVTIFSVVLLGSCANQKQLVEDPPFVLYKPYYLVQEDVTDSIYENLQLYLPIRQISGNVEIAQVYFKDKEASLQKQIGNVYKANIPQIKEEAKWQVVISSKMGEEMNNPLPDRKVEPPLKIEHDEALLVYRQQGKEWYYIFKPQFKKTP